MNLEKYLNWTVSIDCGSNRGTYQGRIHSIDQTNETLTLKDTFHNGILLSDDHSHLMTIQGKDIIHLNLLSQPDSGFQLTKIIQKKSSWNEQQQLKTAPIANNGLMRFFL